MDLQSDLVTSRNGEQSDIGYGALVVNDKDACWDIYNSIRTNNILLQRAESYAGDPREIQEYVSEAHFFRASIISLYCNILEEYPLFSFRMIRGTPD